MKRSQRKHRSSTALSVMGKTLIGASAVLIGITALIGFGGTANATQSMPGAVVTTTSPLCAAGRWLNDSTSTEASSSSMVCSSSTSAASTTAASTTAASTTAATTTAASSTAAATQAAPTVKDVQIVKSGNTLPATGLRVGGLMALAAALMIAGLALVFSSRMAQMAARR